MSKSKFELEGYTEEEILPGVSPGTVEVDSKGNRRLPPLAEAVILERLQFDGDIPEWRRGPPPPGVTPAVSVDTRAMNPVHVGLEMSLLEGDAREKVLMGSQDPELMTWGRVPVPQIANVPGDQLLYLTDKEEQELSWKAISTTQGRRSLCPVMERAIVSRMSSVVSWSDDVPSGSNAISHRWSCPLSTRDSTNAAFSYVETAVQAMCNALRKQLEGRKNFGGIMVKPINLTDYRVIGWGVKIYVW